MGKPAQHNPAHQTHSSFINKKIPGYSFAKRYFPFQKLSLAIFYIWFAPLGAEKK